MKQIRLSRAELAEFKGTFHRYVTLKGGREGNPFCYGALLEGEGGSSDTVT